LNKWGAAFDIKGFGLDQQALSAVACEEDGEYRAHNCNLRYLDSGDFLLMPTHESMAEGMTKTFIHITRTYRARLISRELQGRYFERTLGIDMSLHVPRSYNDLGVKTRGKEFRLPEVERRNIFLNILAVILVIGGTGGLIFTFFYL
jgi:hypothetical protein